MAPVTKPLWQNPLFSPFFVFLERLSSESRDLALATALSQFLFHIVYKAFVHPSL